MGDDGKAFNGAGWLAQREVEEPEHAQRLERHPVLPLRLCQLQAPLGVRSGHASSSEVRLDQGLAGVRPSAGPVHPHRPLVHLFGVSERSFPVAGPAFDFHEVVQHVIQDRLVTACQASRP